MVTNIFDKTHLATKAATEFSVQWSSLSLTRCCAISFDTSGPLHNNSSVSVILWVTKISWVNTQSATKPSSTGTFGRHIKSAMFLFIEIIHQGLLAKNAFYSAKRQICTWQKLAVEMTCWGDGHDSQPCQMHCLQKGLCCCNVYGCGCKQCFCRNFLLQLGDQDKKHSWLYSLSSAIDS